MFRIGVNLTLLDWAIPANDIRRCYQFHLYTYLCVPPYLSQKSRTLTIIRGLKWPIFHNCPIVIVQLPNDDPVGDFRLVTKIQSRFKNLLCAIGTIFEYSSLNIFNELVVMSSPTTNSLCQLSRSKEKPGGKTKYKDEKTKDLRVYCFEIGRLVLVVGLRSVVKAVTVDTSNGSPYLCYIVLMSCYIGIYFH
jgi:hypothetical protein